MHNKSILGGVFKLWKAISLLEHKDFLKLDIHNKGSKLGIIYKFFVKWIYYSHFSESTRRVFVFWYQLSSAYIIYHDQKNACLLT